jgi:hypothetical protein
MILNEALDYQFTIDRLELDAWEGGRGKRSQSGQRETSLPYKSPHLRPLLLQWRQSTGSESELLLDPRESIHITNYEMIRNFFVLGKFLPVSCSSCHIRV